MTRLNDPPVSTSSQRLGPGVAFSRRTRLMNPRSERATKVEGRQDPESLQKPHEHDAVQGDVLLACKRRQHRLLWMCYGIRGPPRTMIRMVSGGLTPSW